jgi:hypothetical protein
VRIPAESKLASILRKSLAAFEWQMADLLYMGAHIEQLSSRVCKQQPLQRLPL